MPFGKWADFDSCVADIMKSQGKDEESAKRICGELQARLGKESFSWVGDIQPTEKNLIRGKAIHPVKTVHLEEWPNIRVYLEEELQKAAHTLVGQPLSIDHIFPLDGKVTGARYEDGAIEYVAELGDEQALNWIKDATIKHCSVEYDWSSLDKVNGVAPRGIHFRGLALLKNLEPGDPASSVEIWNRVAEALKKLKEASGPRKVLEAVWTRSRVNDLPDSAFAIILPGGKKEDGKTVPRSLRKLPHHRPDGSLDLPHLRNANGRLPQSDLSDAQKARAGAHLNAHKKQAGIGAAGEEEMIRKWQEQAGDVPEDQIGEVPEVPETLQVGSEPTLDEVVQAVEDALEEINAAMDQINANFQALQQTKESLKASEEKVKALEKERAELTTRLGEAVIDPCGKPKVSDPISRREVVEMLEGIIPPKQVIFSHGQIGGFKRLVENIMRVKRKIEKGEI